MAVSVTVAVAHPCKDIDIDIGIGMPDRFFDVHGERKLNLSSTPLVFLLVFNSPADRSRLQVFGVSFV